MTGVPPTSELTTHDVENQPIWDGNRDLWRDDAILRQAVGAAGGQGDALAAFGARLGAEEIREAGQAANRNLPELVVFDRGGRRLDEVRFHPDYHRLMALGLRPVMRRLPGKLCPAATSPMPRWSI